MNWLMKEYKKILGELYELKTLIPKSGTNTCEEITIPATISNLFPFKEGGRLYIFCLYFENLREDSDVLLFENLWKNICDGDINGETKNNLTIVKGNYADSETVEEFLGCLISDLLERNYLIRSKVVNFMAFFENPQDDVFEDFCVQEAETDICFLYIISKNTYESLKLKYVLPKNASSCSAFSSSVVKITPKVSLTREEFDTLKTMLNQSHEELRKEKEKNQKYINIFKNIEKIAESAENDFEKREDIYNPKHVKALMFELDKFKSMNNTAEIDLQEMEPDKSA